MLEEHRALRVLAADDDGVILHLITEVLGEAGCKVFSAADGAEALRLLQTEDVDLLLTDFRMPRMNGLELIRWSRANLPYVATVLMTGDTSEWLRAEARSSGAHGFLLKPFPFEHLLHLLEELRTVKPAA